MKLIKALQIVRDETEYMAETNICRGTSRDDMAKAVGVINKMIAHSGTSNDGRARSNWKCPECGRTSKGHTFSWVARNGTVLCDCGSDMELFSVTIDGITQKVK